MDHKAQSVYGQPLAALSVIWGSAAWAQSQSTPGVSAHAAPHPSLTPTAWLRGGQPCC